MITKTVGNELNELMGEKGFVTLQKKWNDHEKMSDELTRQEWNKNIQVVILSEDTAKEFLGEVNWNVLSSVKSVKKEKVSPSVHLKLGD